ncbi:hypothetical protein JXJ21_07325 [candidate division KSB1 bacterium]|nr:hypothetical protein [candidate division KSB1 bacterium]
MPSGKQFKRFSAIIIFLILSAQIFAQQGPLNKNFLKSTDNLMADVVLLEIPTGLVSAQSSVIIRWDLQDRAILYYSAVPGGGSKTNPYQSYVSQSNYTVDINGELQFPGVYLPAGIS